MELFGKLPGFNFLRVSELSPGSPAGRKSYEEEEVQPRPRKRTVRSESSSPPCPESARPRIHDISHDDAWNGYPGQH